MAAGMLRTRRLAPCSLILFAIPLIGQTQDAPCTAMTRVPSPCSEAEKPAPDLVATLDGKPIHLSDLDEATRTEVMGLDEAVATAKQKAPGVDSTPTFFLNGVEQGPSFYTLEGMRAAIDAELAKPSAGNHPPQTH